MAAKDDQDTGVKGFPVGPDLELRIVKVTELREQDLNAQVMAPAQFDRLSENIRSRGALESVPYCAQPEGKGKVEIVSGHHRVRAARAAGLTEIAVLVDTRKMSRSEMVSKQIAHNVLVGEQDSQILRELLRVVDNVDDLLATGLDENYLPTLDDDATQLSTPAALFEWRTISFTFLPHQLAEFESVVEALDGPQDLVGAAPLECFEPFAKALSGYTRIKNVKSVGTAVAGLTRMADRVLNGVEEGWIGFAELVATERIPVDAAEVIKQAIEKAIANDDVSENAPWQMFERWAADYLAGP